MESKMRTPLRFAALAMLGVIALLAAACGTDPEPTVPAGTDTGTGTGTGTTPGAPNPSPTPDDEFDAEAYYSGQTVTIMVNASPGGGFDTFGRLVALHIGQYVPGEPRIIVRNNTHVSQEGGNRIMWTSPPDGLTLGPIHSRWFVRAGLGENIPDFDLETGVILGDPTFGKSYVTTCSDKSFAGSWEDILNSGDDMVVGDRARGSSSMGVDFLTEIGAPARTVYGYGGTSEHMAAFDRGEINSTAYCDDRTVLRLYPEWIEQERLAPIFWMDVQPPEDYIAQMGYSLDDIPYLLDLPGINYTEDQADAFLLARELVAIGRTFMMPNGTPDHLAEVWRQAFRDLVEDPGFIEGVNVAGYGDDFNFGPPSVIYETLELAEGLSQEQLDFVIDLVGVVE